MERFTEGQQAAHQAIAEITADLGPSFVLKAVADALEQAARTETGYYGDNLGHAAGIVRQLSKVLSDESNEEQNEL